MHVIEILLPRFNRSGEAIQDSAFTQTQEELVDRFGLLTTHTVPTLEETFANTKGPVSSDMVVYEVLAEPLDRSWWRIYRRLLQHRFDQAGVVVRTNSVRLM